MRESGQNGHRCRLRFFAMYLAVSVQLLFPRGLTAGSLTISTPQGPVVVDVPHVGPQGDLVAPSAPQSAGFTPPSIFSAPLPSGSGARALGVAGAFTALADDATAASWNPSGLTQLERPELSFVFRASRESQNHYSGSDSFHVGSDRFDEINLNYLSVVYPLHLQRNWVFSANYQEVYDFTQEFTANIKGASRSRDLDSQTGLYQETVDRPHPRRHLDLTVVEHLTTETKSVFQQVVEEQMLSSLDFEQHGIIEAASPALAVDLTKRLAVGMAVNFYQDGKTIGETIRSHIRADYEGYSDSQTQHQDHTSNVRRLYL